MPNLNMKDNKTLAFIAPMIIFVPKCINLGNIDADLCAKIIVNNSNKNNNITTEEDMDKADKTLNSNKILEDISRAKSINKFKFS